MKVVSPKTVELISCPSTGQLNNKRKKINSQAVTVKINPVPRSLLRSSLSKLASFIEGARCELSTKIRCFQIIPQKLPEILLNGS